MHFFKTAAIILVTLAGSFGASQLASGTPLSAGALPLSENVDMWMISKSRWRGGGYRGYRGGYRGYRGGYRGLSRISGRPRPRLSLWLSSVSSIWRSWCGRGLLWRLRALFILQLIFGRLSPLWRVLWRTRRLWRTGLPWPGIRLPGISRRLPWRCVPGTGGRRAGRVRPGLRPRPKIASVCFSDRRRAGKLLETPDGKQVGRAGEQHVIVPSIRLRPQLCPGPAPWPAPPAYQVPWHAPAYQVFEERCPRAGDAEPVGFRRQHP